MEKILFAIAIFSFVFSCLSGVFWYKEYIASKEKRRCAFQFEISTIEDCLMIQSGKIDDIRADIQEIKARLIR